MTYDEKITKFSGITVTLNNKPAKILGFRNKFATVATLDPSGPSFEWSWEAVGRIVQKGGEFKS